MRSSMAGVLKKLSDEKAYAKEKMNILHKIAMREIAPLEAEELVLFRQVKIVEMQLACLDRFIKFTQPDVNIASYHRKFLKEITNNEYKELQKKLLGSYEDFYVVGDNYFDLVTDSFVSITPENLKKMIVGYAVTIKKELSNSQSNFIRDLRILKKMDAVLSYKEMLDKKHIECDENLTEIQAKIKEHASRHLDAEQVCNRTLKCIDQAFATLPEAIMQTLLSLCYKGDLQGVEDFIKNYGENYIHKMNVVGELPLHSACEGGHFKIVQLLLEKGANPRALDERMYSYGSQEGFSAFHYASQLDTSNILELLFEMDGWKSHDILSKNKRTILHTAVEANKPNMVERILKQRFLSWPSCFSMFASRGASIDIHARDGLTGATSLHVACSKGYHEVVEMLISKGAGLYAVNNNGDRPIITALMHKKTDIINILLKYGDKLNDHEKQRMLSFIVDNFDEKICDTLLQPDHLLPSPPSVSSERIYWTGIYRH